MPVFLSTNLAPYLACLLASNLGGPGQPSKQGRTDTKQLNEREVGHVIILHKPAATADTSRKNQNKVWNWDFILE